MVAARTSRAVDDRRWLAVAVELARRCPRSATAFSVGAVIVGGDGAVLATGHSREEDPHDHAEEVALRRLGAAGGVAGVGPRGTTGTRETGSSEGAGGTRTAGDGAAAGGSGMRGAAATGEAATAGRVSGREVAKPDTVTGRSGLAEATLYSSLEPCSARASRPRTCTELILAAGVRRVVFAWREPAVFVDCQGAEILAAAGVEVVELPEFAAAARSVNAHLVHPSR